MTDTDELCGDVWYSRGYGKLTCTLPKGHSADTAHREEGRGYPWPVAVAHFPARMIVDRPHLYRAPGQVWHGDGGRVVLTYTDQGFSLGYPGDDPETRYWAAQRWEQVSGPRVSFWRALWRLITHG